MIDIHYFEFMIKSSLSKEFDLTKINVFNGNVAQLYNLQLESFLSSEERQRASRFVDSLDRTTFVTARAYLKLILGSVLDIPVGKIHFEYGVHGKPVLKDHKCGFNVSHTNGFFTFVITNLGHVGIDIEYKQREIVWDKLMDLVFSDHEKLNFELVNKNEKNSTFLNCWTRKEAFFKAKGSGLSSPLKELSINVSLFSKPQIHSTAWCESEKEEWTLLDLSNNYYFGTIAVHSKVNRSEIRTIELESEMIF